MDLQARKLLYIQENDPSLPVPQSGIWSNSTSANLNHSESGEHYGLSSYRMKPPLDSSMALTALLLLAALFFMGFFTIYIRRLSEVEQRRIRRRHPDGFRRSAKKGLDRKTLESMAVYGYDGGGGSKQMMVECAICLSEFEKGELVKAIPSCGHVFHVGCIDTWLESHLTCPLCRTPKLFPELQEGGSDSV